MNQNDIIQKVFVEITVNNKEKAFSIKDEISSFLSFDVFPKIEKYITDLKYELNDYTLQIPRLELDLDIKNSSLNNELKNKIVKLFEEKLSEIFEPILNSNQKKDGESKGFLIDNKEKAIQTFIYFLENGDLPWWNSNNRSITFFKPSVFQSLITTEDFPKRMTPLLSKQNVKERIVNQFSNKQISQFCLVILKNKDLKINLENDVINGISKLSYSDRLMVWHIVLDAISKLLNFLVDNIHEYISQQISKKLTLKAQKNSAHLSHPENSREILKIIVEIFPFIKENENFAKIFKHDVRSSDNFESNKNSIESADEKNILTQEDLISKNELYAQNAGLILIHPFLKTFFEYCDLLDTKTHQLLDPELCAHLLHYIATGKTNAPEYNMVFEKFLCNIPINQTVNRHIKLSHKHKTQAKNLIESVQHNWSPMKKSSIELLQNEFFQRAGKLAISNHDYTLTIERKTQDILLEKLGWGIGLIKLPWQEKFILVNW